MPRNAYCATTLAWVALYRDPCVRGLPSRRLGIYGRLDADTTGLLLLGTDGGVGQLLHHPGHRVEKRYLVYLKQKAGQPSIEAGAVARFEEGIVLANGERCAPARVELLRGAPGRPAPEGTAEETRDDDVWGLRVYITEGMFHQVSPMHDALSPSVRAQQGAWQGASQEPLVPMADWCPAQCQDHINLT